jgi:hypothetical protein
MVLGLTLSAQLFSIASTVILYFAICNGLPRYNNRRFFYSAIIVTPLPHYLTEIAAHPAVIR